MNSSLDFLNMIKGQMDKEPATKSAVSEAAVTKTQISMPKGGAFAVIDTETNWHDEVMSLGVAIGDASNYKCVAQKYYIFDPECRVGGMYSSVMNKCDTPARRCRRDEAMADLEQFLLKMGVEKIFAYNAKFDYGHLPELCSFQWFDIMRLAAYKQYNHSIPQDTVCCKTGRLKSNYGVEPILRMLTGDTRYFETHNAVLDACDELRIVELLGHELTAYECGRIN